MNHYKISKTDKIIVVMGPTGAGKSTFIDYANGGTGQGVGHSLKSCTKDISVIKKKIGNETFAFVDTPGFNDTERSDYEILGEIASFLTAAHNSKFKIEKLLYLHRISDNRMAGTPLRNLELFATVCGNIAMPRVTIVTTMWSLVDEEVGKHRVAELCGTFWRRMEDGGCEITEFRDTTASAYEILQIQSKNTPSGTTTLLAEETVDRGKKLNATEAGIMLSKQLKKLLQEQKEASARLQQLSQQQSNPAAKSTLEAELEGITNSISVKISELGRLNRSLLDIILGLFSKSQAPVVQGTPS